MCMSVAGLRTTVSIEPQTINQNTHLSTSDPSMNLSRATKKVNDACTSTLCTHSHRNVYVALWVRRLSGAHVSDASGIFEVS